MYWSEHDAEIRTSNLLKYFWVTNSLA